MMFLNRNKNIISHLSNSNEYDNIIFDDII